MSAISGKVCAVTGAGSGIGRAVALELGRRGARGLALADVDEAGLAGTEEQLRLGSAETQLQTLDVSDRAAVEAWADGVLTRFGVVHQIYNNAGIASGHSVLESGYPELERVIGVNLWGVIYGTKAFLPHLIASGDGHVINISSLNGYFAQPKLGAYVTTKFGVRGFTETLRAEMLAAGHQVGVSVVHPGGVKTQIASSGMRIAEQLGLQVTDEDRARERLYNEKLLKMSPERAATIIVDGVEHDRPRIRVGNDAVVIDLVVRAAPSLAPRLAVLFDRLTGSRLAHR
ncbi:MAG TPA: SDR family NAD(P)-dependent oxidoreductase [Solirubrobacteraceae bacterium]|jgi:NAD(P)-dependent dehydrogenase (short-subunit alcohol dehydrogenase family)